MADIQTVITGNVQQAQNILNNLLNQTGQYASSLQSDNQPFFNQAQNIFNSFPNIISQLFNQTIYGNSSGISNIPTTGGLTSSIFNQPNLNPKLQPHVGFGAFDGYFQPQTGVVSNIPTTGGLTINSTSGVVQPNSIEGNFANTESSVSELYNSLYNTINQNFASLQPYINSNFANAENSVNNIYNSLYNRANFNFDNLQQGIKTNFGNAINSVNSLYNSFYNQANYNFDNLQQAINTNFNNAESSVANRYNSLYQNIEQQMQNQWAKSSDVLSALGMYNTPATQQTQADITTQLYGNIAEQETQALSNLDISKANALNQAYNEQTQVLNSILGQQTQALSDLNISEANTLNQALGQQTNVLNSILGQQAQTLSGLSLDNTNTLNQALSQQTNVLNSILGQQAKTLSDLNIANTNTLNQLANEQINALNQVASQQTQALTGLNISNMNTLNQLAQSELSNLINYYQNFPTQEQKFAGWNVQMDPTLTNYGLQLQLAQALNGLNVGVLPQQSELSQFAQVAPGIIGALGGALQLGAGLFGLATGNPLPMFMGFTGGISPWLNMAGNALGSLWSGVENIGGSLLSGIGSVASDIASGIGDVVSGIGDAIGSLFG